MSRRMGILVVQRIRKKFRKFYTGQKGYSEEMEDETVDGIKLV